MTDGIEAVRALNLPGCPTAHFLTDLSEALAVPSLGGTWWVPRVLGAYWGGFHGRGSGVNPDGELRSRMPHGLAKKKTNPNPEAILSLDTPLS